MGLDFSEMEKSFYSVFESHGKIFIEIVRTYCGELNVDTLWENCKPIEKKWEEIVLKHKNPLKWLFFGDYPTSVDAYLYNNRIYGKKLIKNHISRGIILFDLIPLTINYKKIKTDTQKNAYIKVFHKFGTFRQEKWKVLKNLVDVNTKFALTYERQNRYLPHLQKECERYFDFPIQVESWKADYGTSPDIFDRIEKLILLFE